MDDLRQGRSVEGLTLKLNKTRLRHLPKNKIGTNFKRSKIFKGLKKQAVNHS